MQITIELPDDFQDTFDAINATGDEDHQFSNEDMCVTFITDRVLEFRQQQAFQTFQEQQNGSQQQVRMGMQRQGGQIRG
jgi:hypothetical protein